MIILLLANMNPSTFRRISRLNRERSWWRATRAGEGTISSLTDLNREVALAENISRDPSYEIELPHPRPGKEMDK